MQNQLTILTNPEIKSNTPNKKEITKHQTSNQVTTQHQPPKHPNQPIHFKQQKQPYKRNMQSTLLNKQSEH